MKKLLWALLAALPMQAAANDGDPIAYKCYYCTPAEMEDVALAQGVGQHYVYDAQKLTITGYDVEMDSGTLKALAFAAPDWVTRQFLGMMRLYRAYDGTTMADIRNVALLAPGTEHSRSSRYIWAHNLSALVPTHEASRELVHRYLMDHPDTNFLDTSHSGDRLLRFEHMLDGTNPITAQLTYTSLNRYRSYFYFDHGSRQWRFLESIAFADDTIQDNRDDFAPAAGEWRFYFGSSDQVYAEAFAQRAAWGNIPFHGSVPQHGSVRIMCKRAADDIQCYVE